jgi:hypothetical protein
MCHLGCNRAHKFRHVAHAGFGRAWVRAGRLSGAGGEPGRGFAPWPIKGEIAVGHDWSRLTDDDSHAGVQSTIADRAAETKLTSTGSTAEPSHGAGLELAECSMGAGGGCTPRALPTEPGR